MDEKLPMQPRRVLWPGRDLLAMFQVTNSGLDEMSRTGSEVGVSSWDSAGASQQDHNIWHSQSVTTASE